MTPDGRGRFQYTALGGEPARTWAPVGVWNGIFDDGTPVTTPYLSFGAGGFGEGGFGVVGGSSPPTHAQGDIVTLDIDYHYIKLTPKHVDSVASALTVGGQAETLVFGTVTNYVLGLTAITDYEDATYNSEIAVFEAMADSAVAGAVITWWPDYDNYPSESFQCALRKRRPPVRLPQAIDLWDITYDLEVLPTMNIPVTPTFI